MKLLIEDFPYKVTPKISDVLDGLFTLQNVKGEIAVSYVGYFYNPKIRDMVFVLPKVIVDKNGKAFGEYDPNSIVSLEEDVIDDSRRKFLYEFAVWIHRAIVVFREKNPESTIVHARQIESEGRGIKKRTNTLLDVILALIRFNKENKAFFTFVLKNIHSGFNKINWAKTISNTSAVVDGSSPVYLNPVNKKRQINFDEELIVIFFSILNYVSERYGFSSEMPFGFKLIKGAQFEKYVRGYGRRRLRQIKYKYFADTALKLWDLCYAFFDKTYQINTSAVRNEYLLVNSFHTVFESVIEELIGDKDVPAGLKEQEDAKLVDHFYTHDGLLIDNRRDNDIYYIGDSKYYKIGSNPGSESVAKQYTYARNVIQWNLNLFLPAKTDETEEEREARIADKGRFGKIELRDSETEGYNVIPNFFISAAIDPETLTYADTIREHEHKEPLISRQFENRLYDRDTLILSHFDVNFLHIISLYARNNAGKKAAWKAEVRDKFRKSVQKLLREHFTFYALAPHTDVDPKEYFKAHFKETLGKTYRPFEDRGIFSLALDKSYPSDNDRLLASLGENFYVVPVNLGEDPSGLLDTERTIKGAVESPDGMGKFLFANIRKYNKDSDVQKSLHKDYIAFSSHEATSFIMRITEHFNGDITTVRFFVPMFDGGIEGYYEIEGITFGSRLSDAKDHDGNPVRISMPCLNIKLGKYTSFGDGKSAIPKYRHWNGQIHSYAEVIAQYKQGL